MRAHDTLDFDPATPLGRHNADTNILISDPVLSRSSPQPSHQQIQRRLPFFPSNIATHRKTSPSRAHLRARAHLDPKAHSRSHSRSEIAMYPRKDILLPNMTSTASSSAVNKGYTSPSKVSSGGVNTHYLDHSPLLTAIDTHLRRQASHPRDAPTRHARRS